MQKKLPCEQATGSVRGWQKRRGHEQERDKTLAVAKNNSERCCLRSNTANSTHFNSLTVVDVTGVLCGTVYRATSTHEWF